MNRFLQKLLLNFTFLLLLGGWYRIYMTSPLENTANNEQPSVEQSSIHSQACLIPATFQLAEGALGAQIQNVEPGHLSGNLHSFNGPGSILNLPSFTVDQENAAGRYDLFLLYRKLRL